MIIINFKNYKSGKDVVQLAKLVDKHLPRAVVCPPVLDLEAVRSVVKRVGVYAQHVDCVSGSMATGWLTPEALKKIGVKGVLLNHSEHRLPYAVLKDSVKAAKKAGLKVIVCIPSVSYLRYVKKLNPWAIAFEDAKLIGSGKSITSYRSAAVKRFAIKLRRSKIKALCGAGINSVDDVRAAKRFGCDGVLIASAIAKDLNKGEEFLKGIRKVYLS